MRVRTFMIGATFVALGGVACDQPPEPAAQRPAAETPPPAPAGAEVVQVTIVRPDHNGKLAVLSEEIITRRELLDIVAARQRGRQHSTSAPAPAGSGDVTVKSSAYTLDGSCADLSTLMLNDGPSFSGTHTLCVKYDPFSGATPWWIGWTPRSYDPSNTYAAAICSANLQWGPNCTSFGSEAIETICDGFPTVWDYTKGGGYVNVDWWRCIR